MNPIAVQILAWSAAAALLIAVLAWINRSWTITILSSVIAVLVARALIGWTLLITAVVILLVGIVVVVGLRRGGTRAVVSRWGARSRRKSGVASTVDLARKASVPAIRRKATVVRPSLGDLSWWHRRRVPAAEFGVLLCRVGPQRVWTSIENVIAVFGGPRTGKSEWLKCAVVDAPGAVLATSTRTDLYDETARLRARRGPVYVFNPTGLGDLPSTIHFDPLTGCADPVTAAERATDMLAAGATGTGGDREFWDAQARRVLASLLHAAALGGLSMRHVLEWVANPDEGAHEVGKLLRRSPEPAYTDDAAQFLATNDRTRTSITSTIMPALGWLTSPAASAAAGKGTPFDVADLLRTRATVYLLGEHEAQTAPLLCALTGHIARQARRIAARCPGGRLDPPLTLTLDEAALTCPVPLDQWTADMGGRGICIIPVFQSFAQVLARWGETGANAILTNAGATMLFGGTKGADLDHWVRLAGQRDERIPTTDHRGRVTSHSVRTVPVLSAAQLSDLPDGWVMVKCRGLAAVLGKAPQARKRRDLRAARRQAAREASAVLAAAEAATRSGAPHSPTAVEVHDAER